MRSAKELINLESHLGTSDCHLSPLTVITVNDNDNDNDNNNTVLKNALYLSLNAFT